MKCRWLVAVCWMAAFNSCHAQTKNPNPKLEGMWLIDLEEADIGYVRTVMRFEAADEKFEAFTRKGADKDILGGWTSTLGRTFTKSFKDGSLLRLERGIFRDEGDTVRMAAILASALGSYNAEGYAVGDELFLKIRKGETQKGSILGHRRQVALPMEKYPAIFEKSVAIADSKIYNRAVLQSKAWQQFLTAMRGVTPKLQDDLEMVFAFFYYAGKLPFSHFALIKTPPDQSTETTESSGARRVFLEEKTAQTAYMKIVSFDGSAAEMDSIFSVVRQRGYANLIVDLRNNPGGTVEAGMAFASNLTDSPFYGGVFLTQKYFNAHAYPPPVSAYDSFPHFTAANYDLIIEGIHNTAGLCLKVLPAAQHFRGKVFLLTNGKTASTCEPIVYGLKQRHRAVVVGEKTAGAMLNGEMFDVEAGFKMVVPTADYYASDGFRIDGNGVKPDVRVEPDGAVEYVMSRLIK